ncbi:MAG TPA: DUF5060 domain-containing protein [Bryobacteraceae bacterium]|nr:DUF5060 domain-containing protein [Bryobacteraceae bacterium]
MRINSRTTSILLLLLAGTLAGAQESHVERWGIYEVKLDGPKTGNPFLDVKLSASFQYEHRAVQVDGFYDGDGVYRIRFMPDELGQWTYRTSSNVAALDGKTGSFTVTAPSAGNHGPVRVRYVSHFAYEDGTPYVPIGTTCYAWIHQGDKLEEETLATLSKSPFNKIRMLVFPKSYVYNTNEPVYYPFPRNAKGENDYTHFNPEFFRHLEKRVHDLQELGIEADLILFHPYDRWGYSHMPPEVDDRYLHYIVARLAAYRNVWWSMANEYDFLKAKTMADWDRFFRIVQESDPYQHLRSIHNGSVLYDHSKPWVTHVSIQSSDLMKARELVATYRKPVIFDECKYEGNIPRRWGNLSAQEMVHRFWLATVSGAYAGHGETYLDPNDVLWWSKGGVLHGQSPARLAFLRKILAEAPREGLNNVSTYYLGAGQPGRYYLFYFDVNQPAEYEFELAPGVKYHADIIDPWEMTITPVSGTFEGKFTMKLPGKPYMAVRFEKID